MPAAGNRYDVIARVYEEYYPKLYKYTLYRVGNHSIAEDLVSDAFEKALTRYNTYNPEKAKLSTWLFAIVNNTIINYHKKQQHYSPSLELENMESKYRLEDLVIELELKEILLKSLMALDERQRNIVALKFGAGLTNREIAQITELTESNVGTILYRALRRLRDIIKQDAVKN